MDTRAEQVKWLPGGYEIFGRPFAEVEGALNFIVNYYTYLADYRSVLDRLATFDAATERADELMSRPAAQPTEKADIALDLALMLPDGQQQQRVVDGGATLSDVNGRLFRALAANDFSLFYLADSRANPPLPPADARHTDACSLPVS